MMFIMMFPFFIIASMIFLFLSFIFLCLNFSLYIHWVFFCSSFCVSFPMYMDYISCLFMGVVLLISGSIMFYSEYYMSHELYQSRFFYLMFLFVISMIFLILCPNFFCMLLGWDGLGLISFCLVLYYQNSHSLSSAMITALTNRVGDVFVLASISMFFSMGSFNYMNFVSLKDLFWISFFFVIASMTKSAQIPFSAWLPAAMAAPTPVSSLVHSSTLVTAGVYIMIRFGYLITLEMKTFLMFISLLTMIMSGLSGLMEFDLKKIIALSTLSQLGFMMFTLSLGFCDLAFFHLVCHASFKALLFMCAGLFIHDFSNNQDIRYFGLLNKNYFFSVCMFNVANLSLCGFPFLSGFYSKDLILEMCLKMNINYIMLFFLIFGTFLTVFYSFRLLIFMSMKNLSIYSPFLKNSKEMEMNLSMFILFFFSISFGHLYNSFMFLPYNYIVLPLFLKTFILLVCLFSFLFCYFYSMMFNTGLSNMIFFIWNMWFLSFLKTDLLKNFVFKLSVKSSDVIYGFIEDFLGLKSVFFLKNLSNLLNNFFFINFLNFFVLFSFFFIMFLILSV